MRRDWIGITVRCYVSYSSVACRRIGTRATGCLFVAAVNLCVCWWSHQNRRSSFFILFTVTADASGNQVKRGHTFFLCRQNLTLLLLIAFARNIMGGRRGGGEVVVYDGVALALLGYENRVMLFWFGSVCFALLGFYFDLE